VREKYRRRRRKKMLSAKNNGKITTDKKEGNEKNNNTRNSTYDAEAGDVLERSERGYNALRFPPSETPLRKELWATESFIRRDPALFVRETGPAIRPVTCGGK
jgi:hypothetical protein